MTSSLDPSSTGDSVAITPSFDLELSPRLGDGAQAVPASLSLSVGRGGLLERRRAAADAELAGVLVNRSRNGDSPFVPIVKTPTHAQNSGNLTGYAVEIADSSQDSGFRHVGTVGEKYLLMHNLDVRRLALDVADRSGFGFREAQAFWDGNRFIHVIEFEKTESVVPGDDVALSLITRSSYDKSSRFDMSLGALRLVCSNGMLAGDYFARVAFKHTSGQTLGSGLQVDEETWEQTVLQGLSIIEHSGSDLSRFVRGLRKLHASKMTDALLRDVWGHLPKLGDGVRGKIVEQYLTSEEPTLFGLLNAGTNRFTHNPKLTQADFANNDAWTSAFLDYAFENVN